MSAAVTHVWMEEPARMKLMATAVNVIADLLAIIVKQVRYCFEYEQNL